MGTETRADQTKKPLGKTYLKNKVVINELFGQVGIKVRRLDETQEELVHDLKVRPCQLQDRLIFFWIKGVASGVHLGRDSSEEIGCKLDRQRIIENVELVGHFRDPFLRCASNWDPRNP